MLDAAGLTATEEAVYRALVGTTSASPAELRDQLGCPPAKLSQALGRLERLGLVSRTPGRQPRYVAAPPDVAVEPLVLAQQVRLEQARAQAAALMDRYRSARRSRGTGELVEVVVGLDAIRQRFEQLQRTARKQVCAFVMPPFLTDGGDDQYREIELAQLARGVAYRTVYSHDGFAAQGGLEAMLADVAAGEEVRIADRLPIKLFLVDDQVAFVPMTGTDGDEPPGAVVVHPSGLLTALAALFERVWAQAAPFGTDGAPADADTDRVLALLRAGFTDAAIARQLGTSTRTVQRRIRELMDRAGAQTRFQLGCRATELGWLAARSRAGG
ncbi:MAG TPA: helix-turn-helix domain-containing protein [Natronosporangium sp.]